MKLQQKLLVRLIAILLILLSLSSCGIKQVNDSLAVFCTEGEFFGQYFNSAITEYEKQSGISVTVWDQMLPQSVKRSSWEEQEEYRLGLRTAIMAGDSPDVFILKGYEFRKELYKMIEAGVFLDFDTLIKKDRNFTLTNYEEIIMDTGYYSGKRYILPLMYVVPHIVVSEEKMSRFGVNVNDVTSYESFLDTALRLHKDNKTMFTRGALIFGAQEYAGWSQEAVDYENKSLNLETDTYDKLIRFYKEELYLGSKIKADYTSDYNELMNNENGLFYFNEELMGLTKVLSSSRDTNDTIIILPLPSNYGCSTACVTYFAMISSSSKNIDNAWEFVKVLLGEEFQKEVHYYLNQVGVYSPMIDYNIERFTEINSLSGPIPDKYIERMKESYKNYDNATIYGFKGDIMFENIYIDYFYPGELSNNYSDCYSDSELATLKEELKQYYSIWFSE